MKLSQARPWLLALLTLGLALVPVFLAWRDYRDEARRKDEQLFDATSGLVGERLQLITVRHINVFNILRNQLRMQTVPARDSLRIPPTLRASFPHLLAFGYAAAGENRTTLQWTSTDAHSPISIGDDIAANPQRAAAIERAMRSPAPVVTTDSSSGDRLFVVEAVGDAGRPRGYVVGWLDVASLCADSTVPMLSDGVLIAAPLAESAKAPSDARVISIREGGAEFPVMISRGPKFAATYGQVPPLLVFAAGAGCAVLLAFLVLQAMRASQLRAELEAERMRGRLVQSFSHEFRTPLSVILSSADLLEAGGSQLDTTRRAEVIAQIQDSTQQLSEMAEEILLLSRLESQRTQPRPAPVELHGLCESLVRDTNTATRNRCRIEVNADGTATLDSAILRPALANLLSNAVKYSAPGEVVRLTVERRNDTLIFAVSDSGIGIPNADLARIGEPFHRAANVGETPGTGLGLAIVRRSITLLGGTLSIESKEGHGTIAMLRIPVA